MLMLYFYFTGSLYIVWCGQLLYICDWGVWRYLGTDIINSSHAFSILMLNRGIIGTNIIIMIFTRKERIAITKLLMEMIGADDVIHFGEKLYLTQLSKQLDLTEDIFKEVQAINTLSAMAIVKDMSKEKKFATGTMLSEMAKADGHIDEKETLLLTIVLVGCELLSPEEINALS